MDQQQSQHFPDSFARVTTKGLYIKDGKILLCKDETGLRYGAAEPFWELPGGGWDFGETFSEALKRELREEMNLEVTAVSEKPVHVWTVRKENSRKMDWHYVAILLYKIDILTLESFTPTIECRELGFYTYDEFMQLEPLYIQTRPLRSLITKKDFV